MDASTNLPPDSKESENFAARGSPTQPTFGTTDAYGETTLISDKYDNQSDLTPDRIAVEQDAGYLTYAGLREKSNRLARYLLAQGIRPDGLVSICLERSPKLVVAVLATIKAGGAYLPLDPSYPRNRLLHMVEDSKPQLFLTQKRLLGVLPSDSGLVIALDEKEKEIELLDKDDVDAEQLGLSRQHLIYAIYTSGSTGKPKATAMTHDAMASLIEWHRQELTISDPRRVLQFAALSFDVAFQEIFSTLCLGGTLVLANERIRRDMEGLTKLLVRSQVDTLFVPPLVLQAMAEHCRTTVEVLPALRDVITAGEQLRVTRDVVSLFRRLSSCRLHNHYGPTETHVATSLTLVGDPGGWPDTPPIGRPIHGVQAFILDHHQRPVPPGESGEIYIGGRGLARGYLYRPTLTAERFVSNWSGLVAGVRFYKTGDLGRVTSDGILEYIGRSDNQVKLRGYRIEPGEIEACLARHNDVKSAAVIVHIDSAGDKRLVAYLTCRSDRVNTREIRDYLGAVLPEYMIPTIFVVLESLPMSPNGKVDRNALPKPREDAPAIARQDLPVGAIEESVASIWQRVLGVEAISRSANFFEYGGHSIKAVRMSDMLRQIGLFADASSIYESPTLAEFSRHVRRSDGLHNPVPENRIPPEAKSIAPEMLTMVQLTQGEIDSITSTIVGGAANIEDIYPLTPLQAGILFHHELTDRDADTYVLPMLLSISSSEALARLISALMALIQRHAVLRTAVLWQGISRPVQVVQRAAWLPIEEVSLDAERDVMQQLLELMSPDRQKLDLRRAPLIRLQVARETHSSCTYAVLQLHHFAGDHEAVETMLAEIAAHVDRRLESYPPPVPYRNHVWQALAGAAACMRDAERFFRRKLGGITESTAPFGLLDVRGTGTRIVQRVDRMPRDLSDRLRETARVMRVSPATLFHAIWAIVVSKTSHRKSVVFGTVLLGRLRANSGSHGTLGMFINTLPIHVVTGDTPAIDLVQQVQRGLIELINYEHVSLSSVQKWSGVGRAGPLFTSLLNYRHAAVPFETEISVVAPGIEIVRSREWTNYPVVLSVDDWKDEFILTAQTDRDVSPELLLGYVIEAARSLIVAIATAPHRVAAAINIVPERDRTRCMWEFNGPESPFSRELPIPAVLGIWVSRTPDAVALTSGLEAISYGSLDRVANQWARRLMLNGIQVGDRVVLAMRRSLDMITVMLGALKIGATYVPVDPSSPSERIGFIAADSGAKVAVCDGTNEQAFEGMETLVVVPAAPSKREICLSNEAAPLVDIHPESPAYVMYTSGSSGRPKGVVVPQRAINRLVLNNRYAEVTLNDCVAHCSNPAFDASTFEIWSALLNGAKAFVASQEIVLDAEAFSKSLISQQVSVLWMTVGLLAQFVEQFGRVFSQLRCLIAGGDVFEPDLARAVLREAPDLLLLNGYGPTECTTFAATHRVTLPDTRAAAVPIGRPIANTTIYIVGNGNQIAPIGAVGEICIGGQGLALGYAGMPERTAEQFVPNPFSEVNGERLYRTGDLGRWRPDGVIEYLGRSDRQVKIRGFRIELAEIEARLRGHPSVSDAVVVAREDSPGDRRLVAYVVPNKESVVVDIRRHSNEASKDVVRQWRQLYEETYTSSPRGPTFVGWNSSYTGREIPEEEMREWLAATVERIRAIRPKRVLEIGCGVGLLLQHIAPQCVVYVGTDFSEVALDGLRGWVGNRGELRHVELQHRAADDVEGFADHSFDTIILNSVIQYFPDVGYLDAVLRRIIRLLTPGGKLFVGDVRDYRSLRLFQSAVQVARAAATVTGGQIRRRVARAVAQEKELLVNASFFDAAVDRLPDIKSVSVQVKRGRHHNEMTRYRYDVVLSTAHELKPASARELRWTEGVWTLSRLESELIQMTSGAVRVLRIPNRRVAMDKMIQVALEESDESVDASSLRNRVNVRETTGVDPESLWQLAERYRHHVAVTWDRELGPEFLEAVFCIPESMTSRQVEEHSGYRCVDVTAHYANEPVENAVRQQCLREVREHLVSVLPDYMVPGSWIALRQLPLTSNGKIDRSALPAPESRPEELGEYVEPRNAMERIVSGVWAQILRVDQIGAYDNFFELGGHSLLATQVVVRLSATLKLDVPIRVLFAYPTVEALSARIDAMRHEKLIEVSTRSGSDLGALVDLVANLPNSRVQELVHRYRSEGKP